ncbi:LOW QUALITY PROTEIN: hypothetical protein PHMEG_00041212 [Phytophthora megakarya]|uniref:Retrotransposon gag domain-containing protein n=1 Tax=Phytophthora megakarya TaxID=4795 RepID=A0A225UEP4_9STRA|nr:LOW QUALITY PROTEIN: hypothetical protein PHMEG_00041212 [Phytophthora megakarya]
MRDQASDDEKCLTFAALLAGSAKNWYRQLSRSTRNKWSELLQSFQIQYCGLGVSQGNTTIPDVDPMNRHWITYIGSMWRDFVRD